MQHGISLHLVNGSLFVTCACSGLPWSLSCHVLVGDDPVLEYDDMDDIVNRIECDCSGCWICYAEVCC